MMNFRLFFAQDVAEQIGAMVCPERCIKCGMPLLEKIEQAIPFCWFCVTDRISALRGRTALTKAKMALRGIIVVPENAHPLAKIIIEKDLF